MADDNSGTLTKYINGVGIYNKLRVQTGSDVKYFLADHLGSTNALTDASGNVSSSASYDSFGNATGNLSTRYQFTGREYDNFTGLHYYRARWYDGNLGRFISEDPIGFAGGDVNLYGYVGNKPLNFFDPFGLDEYSMMERLGNQQPDNRTISEKLDDLQMQLGMIGMAPIVGEPADALDGLISLGRGNYGDAALSGGAMFPFIGWGAGITKMCKRVDNLPKGGVYRLIDSDTGEVMRTGRSKDLAKRQKDHARDSRLKDFEFDPVFRTDRYDEQRGLEDMLYNNYPDAPFNFTPALSKRNKNRQKYKDAANEFLKNYD